ncbi:hypothetical protein BX600DRAFT_14843 [Xylariales sp. PMI_506]|nr:hypothetical protein BX600DRAFT_14843 [Xylariales sp. PMI_506]
MTKIIPRSWGRQLRRCRQWMATIPANLQQGHLWQRIIKNTLCTAIMLAVGLIPAVISVYGTSTYLGAMVTVFGSPGQRFGQMTESLSLITLGTAIGLGWSLLGLYLSSLVMEANASAAYGIRASFFALAVIFHGILRSSTPRLFLLVFFFLLISLTILTTTAKVVTSAMVAQITYPMLTAIGVIILVNIAIFPESSSGFLGKTAIETLNDTVRCLEDAGDWFMSDPKETSTNDEAEKEPGPSLRTRLASLTDRKDKLRAKLAGSKKAQAECNFEVVYAVLPPRSLKPISVTSMTGLVQNTITLINACESKYAMVDDEEQHVESDSTGKGDQDEDDSSSSDSSSDDSSSDDTTSGSDDDMPQRPKPVQRKSKHVRNLELVKPVREIESGDLQLLEHILSQIRAPAKVLQGQIHQALNVITCSLGYAYEVSKLPSGIPPPRGVTLEEIDIRIDIFTQAMALFDRDSAAALETAATMAYKGGSQVDLMPRMETFLISSFLISLRQAAAQVAAMMVYCRSLVEIRQAKHGRRRIYFPRISWKKWLKTGGEQDINSVPENARKEARAGHGTREENKHHDEDETLGNDERMLRRMTDEETGPSREKMPGLPEQGKIPRRKGPAKSDGSITLWLRGLAADLIEFLVDSDDLAFALKLSFAGWLITWPAFVPSMNAWYASIKASWASLQLILVFEVSVGTSIMGFFLRIIGVIYGCVVGFLSYEIGQGNRVVSVVIMVIGIIPAAYVHLGTPYVKTGIISIVSMAVVGLATIITPDVEPWGLFVKRMACFVVGGTLALVVELILFPVRARDQLVESLASSIQQISNMESAVAIGIDSPGKFDINSPALDESFTHAREKAQAALSAARTFLPFTLTEPRLKGSFKGQAMIYNEIIYVLFQIIDRMNNMLYMRKAYGSAVLEDLNELVLPYRRNVAASITLTLFAVHEALTTRLPLPQFLPSSRVAQLRYISRVREIMLEQSSVPGSSATSAVFRPNSSMRNSALIQSNVLKSVTKQRFLSWNAGSAGMMEIIEYLEELVDLAKLLVGVNAFRTGMLERPKFQEYVRKIKERELASATAAAAEAESARAIMKTRSDPGGGGGGGSGSGVRKRRGFSFRRSNSHGAALHKRGTFGSRIGADAAVDTSSGDSEDDRDAIDDLPMSLQRVRTRRIEERELGRARRASMTDPKGKGPLRGAQTWAI